MSTMTRTQTGAPQRLTAERLTGAGFSVSPSTIPHDRRLRIAGDGVVWLLGVTDQAEACLMRLPTDASDRDPHHLANLAATLLTGRPAIAMAPNTARIYPEIRLDGIAGLDLRDRGFAVELKVYSDDFRLDALSDIEVTNPPGASADQYAVVTIGDDGSLSWHRDYRPDHADVIADPAAVAGIIAAAIIPALAYPRES